MLSLIDFLRTGTFGDINENSTKADIMALFGKPTHYGNVNKGCELLCYNNCEISFYHGSLHYIFIYNKGKNFVLIQDQHLLRYYRIQFLSFAAGNNLFCEPDYSAVNPFNTLKVNKKAVVIFDYDWRPSGIYLIGRGYN